MSPERTTRSSSLVMPSLPLPVTVSEPVPVIVRSASLKSAAFTSASSA